MVESLTTQSQECGPTSIHTVFPDCPYYSCMLLSCLTCTELALVDLFGMASQMGSTSGPSKSPAPSQPQHHTVEVIVKNMHLGLYRRGGYIPCEGPGTNPSGSLSSSVNKRSWGPNHVRSWGSVRGSSGRPPSRTYPLIAVRFRRAGWMISYTLCEQHHGQLCRGGKEQETNTIICKLNPWNHHDTTIPCLPVVVTNQTTLRCAALSFGDLRHTEADMGRRIERCWVQDCDSIPARLHLER